MLWQFLQKLISLRILSKLELNFSDCSFGCLNKWSTKRRAVLLPIPGSCDISLTAFSRSFEENSIAYFGGKLKKMLQKKRFF
jgi:hypothetical protein